MYRKFTSVVLSSIVFLCLLCGCATAEMDTKTTDQSRQGSNSLEDLSSDDERHISESYGDTEYSLKLDASISIPNSRIQTGTFQIRSIDVSLIEKFLCDGEKLSRLEHKDADDDEKEVAYVSDTNEVKNDLDYDLLYVEYNDIAGAAGFTNFRLDKVLSGTGFIEVGLESYTDEQGEFVNSMEKLCQQLFVNLGLEANIECSYLLDGDKEDCCVIGMNSLIDGIPLIMDHKFVQSSVRIGNPGVNSVAFQGLYEVSKAEDVTILSIDEVLGIIKKGVEDKQINSYKETMNTIRLAYMVAIENDIISFYPVWAFCSYYDGGDTLLPRLCINAQNGDIEMMW